MLTRMEAERELSEALRRNPGPWGDHSRSVADNARRIAEKTGTLDPEKAYILGLMHDIGRREGVTAMAHVLDGYDHMMALGQPEIARVCMTHSFPVKSIETFFGRIDVSQDGVNFLDRYLNEIQYDDYDRLIQLCDAISLPNGACIMEKRLVDVALRYGFAEGTLEKWRAFLKLKKHFDGLCGCSIYDLLPNVVENSKADLF